MIQSAQTLRQQFMVVIFGHRPIRGKLGVQIQMHQEFRIGVQSVVIQPAQNLRQRIMAAIFGDQQIRG